MRKNPEKRIGHGAADASEIKMQDWFKVFMS
jgi:hypothetical protein